MIYDELEAIKEDGITQEELKRAKTRSRSNLIGQLDSNQGLALQFAQMEELKGDWRSVFRRLDAIQAITVEAACGAKHVQAEQPHCRHDQND